MKVADSSCWHASVWGNEFYAKEGQAFNLTSLAFPDGGIWNDKVNSRQEASLR